MKHSRRPVNKVRGYLVPPKWYIVGEHVTLSGCISAAASKSGFVASIQFWVLVFTEYVWVGGCPYHWMVICLTNFRRFLVLLERQDGNQSSLWKEAAGYDI